MIHLLAADAVLILHLVFVLFVILGGFFLRYRWVRRLHLPAAAWGALVELGNFPCPLTPLEVRLRVLGGEAGYAGGFIEHYLFPLLYPAALTRWGQVGLGGAVILINLILYVRWLRAGRCPPPHEGGPAAGRQ